MLSASRRQPHLLHVSAVDRRQTWSMDKSWRCDIVWISPQSHSSLSVKPHFLWHANAIQWPWPVRKWLLPDHKSRTEGLRKLKNGWREAHDMEDRWPHLEVEWSKVKVTKPLKCCDRKSALSSKRKGLQLQTWYMDRVQWLASSTCSNLQAKSSRWLLKSPLARVGAHCVSHITGCTACFS